MLYKAMIVLMMVILISFTASAQGDRVSIERNVFFLPYFTSGSYLDAGVEGNRFNYNSGIGVELFIRSNDNIWFSLGTNYFIMNNIMGDDIIRTTFYTPAYLELNIWPDGINSVFGYYIIPFGFDWTRMSFEDSKGADNQYLFSIGGGLTLMISNSIIFKTKIKPYYAEGNTLNQKWGLMFQVGLGF